MKLLIVGQIFVAATLGFALPPKGEIQVVYQGEACECGPNLAFIVEQPKEQPPNVIKYDFKYKIDAAAPKPYENTRKYIFDFDTQRPKEIEAKTKLESYAFDVVVPTVPEEAPKYNFDYQIQEPVESNLPLNIIQGLFASVDKVLMNRPDCVQPKPECHCPKYQPTIEVLRSCPLHGPRFRQNEALDILQIPVNNRIRSKRELSVEDYLLSSDAFVEHQFYDRYAVNDMFDADALPIMPLEETTEKPQKRFQLKNFLKKLKQKPGIRDVPQRKVLQFVKESGYDEKPIAPTPKTIKDRVLGLKKKLARMFGRQNIIMKEQQERRKKRNADTDNVVEENKLNPNNGLVDGIKNLDRSRKHCPICENENPGSVCGGGIPPAVAIQQEPPTAAQPQYVQYVEGSPVPYSPYYSYAAEPNESAPSPPKFVYDRMGHRYLEQDGRLRLMQPEYLNNANEQLGSSYQQPEQYYHILENIISHNRRVIDDSNIEGGHLSPDPIKATIDSFKFLHEAASQGSADVANYRTVPSPYETVGAGQPHNPRPSTQPSKRSFNITPVLKNKNDGSVFVKISPRKHLRPRANDKDDELLYKAYTGHSAAEDFRNTLGDDDKRLASGEQSYQILSLDGDDERSTPLDEKDDDLDVLRYIYETQTKPKPNAVNAKKPFDSSKKGLLSLKNFLRKLRHRDDGKELAFKKIFN